MWLNFLITVTKAQCSWLCDYYFHNSHFTLLPYHGPLLLTTRNGTSWAHKSIFPLLQTYFTWVPGLPHPVVFNLRYIRITWGAFKKKRQYLHPAFGDPFPVAWCVSWALAGFKAPQVTPICYWSWEPALDSSWGITLERLLQELQGCEEVLLLPGWIPVICVDFLSGGIVWGLDLGGKLDK